ncbi:LCP family protein [Frankia sp. R82]|uniref:LCP family protein n=1 Tax=Frankia sp. R82 TaxID=2950553 RepID=UPI002043101C|nr:LCP family protein [Frankia sp. R82]
MATSEVAISGVVTSGVLPEDALPAGGLSVVAMAKAGGPSDRDEPPAPPVRRRLRSRLLLWLAGLVSFTVLVTSVAGWVIITAYDRRIDRADIALPHADVTRPPTVPVGTENWLLVGSDVRTGSDAAKVGGARSDTMMIAHLDSDGTTSVVSVPRDLYVPIPSYTDADGTSHRARRDRVNSAFNSGGPALLVATLEQLTGVRIDHYAEIDFGGFQQMTTAIGGVDVCLVASPYVEPLTLDNGRRVHSTNLNDPSSGFVGVPGTNHLVGAQALAFVRQRHGFLDGDLSRIHRQQAFMAAVFRKVASSDVLLSPAKLTSFLNALTNAAVLDDGTSLADLRLLAERLRGMNTGSVTFATIPITGQVSSPAFYFYYDPNAVRAFFAEQMGERAATTAPTPTGSPAEAAGTDASTARSATATISDAASQTTIAATAPVVVAGTALPGADQATRFTAVTPTVTATGRSAAGIDAAGSTSPSASLPSASPTVVPTTTAAAACIN